MDEKLMHQWGWKNICKGDCYHPWAHTHEFELSGYPEKTCSKCNNEMELDAQLYQTEFGKNKRILINSYKCLCGNTDKLEINF